MGSHNSQLYRNNRNAIKQRVAKTGEPCHLCGMPIDLNAGKAEPLSFTVDHVIPVSAGGTDLMNNLVPAHFKCNRIKSDQVVVGKPKKGSKATRKWW